MRQEGSGDILYRIHQLTGSNLTGDLVKKAGKS